MKVLLLDTDGVLREVVDSVRHVSHPEHVQAHVPWFAERVRTTVADGADLWQKRTQLFPQLDFCREVERQVTRFDAGSAHLRNIFRRLLELDAAFSTWTGASIHPDFVLSKCTPETPQTLREEEADHTFTLPTGETQIFKWHVRFTPGAGRIFFDGTVATRRGVIGYIGIKNDGRLV